ncbi:MAG TPA: hypothetical protein VFS23_08175 [Vicinamibacterales bacterium]|nr:hypothetical protein [Vicinamibacterales bacterium]
MFRAAVLSIVLTLVAGPNASLLCAVWCHPEAAAAGPCEHRDATTTITSNDSCPDIAAVTTAFVREDVRRGVSSSEGQIAVLVAPFEFVAPPQSSLFGRELRQHPPLEARPLVVTLRI